MSKLIIKYTKSFDRTKKYLKKHPNEEKNLNLILELIKNIEKFEDLNNPIFKLYDFERLKHYKGIFCSFNLEKNGGVIRLIIEYNKEKNYIYLAYISYDHYKDFNESKVIYYDE